MVTSLFARTLRSVWQVPGFALKSLGQMFSSPLRIFYWASPMALGVVLTIAGIYLTWTQDGNQELLEAVLGPESWLLQTSWLAVPLSALAFLLLVAAISVAAFVLSSLVGALFLDFYLESILQQQGLMIPEGGSLASRIKRIVLSLYEELKRLLAMMLATMILFLSSFFPFLLVVTIFLTLFLFGYSILDYPLALCGHPFKERFTRSLQMLPVTLVLGGLTMLCMMIPFGLLLCSPLLYGMAVSYLCQQSDNL